MTITTIRYQYEMLRQARRFAVGAACAGHDFTDDTPDRSKRLRMGEVRCEHCGLIVPILAALMYEVGKRHGQSGAR